MRRNIAYVNIVVCIEHVASLAIPIPYAFPRRMHVAGIPPRSESNKLRGNFVEIRKLFARKLFLFFLSFFK